MVEPRTGPKFRQPTFKCSICSDSTHRTPRSAWRAELNRTENCSCPPPLLWRRSRAPETKILLILYDMMIFLWWYSWQFFLYLSMAHWHRNRDISLCLTSLRTLFLLIIPGAAWHFVFLVKGEIKMEIRLRPPNHAQRNKRYKRNTQTPADSQRSTAVLAPNTEWAKHS